MPNSEVVGVEFAGCFRDVIGIDDFDEVIMDRVIIDETLLIDKDEVREEKEKEYCITKIKSILN